MGNWFRRHKNDILMWSGLALNAFGTFLACRATLKVEKECTKSIKKIEGKNGQEKKKIEKSEAKKLVKAYAGAVGVKILGTGLIIGGFDGVKKDCGKLLTAATGQILLLKDFEKQCQKELGTEKVEEIKQKCTNGIQNNRDNGINHNDFALFFGPEYSDIASGDGFVDFGTLKDIEKYANNYLNKHKNVTMEDIVCWLGMTDWYGGSVNNLKKYGWEHGDIVDFGLFCSENMSSAAYIAYCNGFNDTIMLNFNCKKL